MTTYEEVRLFELPEVDPATTRWCNWHLTYHPIAEFGLNRHRKDGLMPYCRASNTPRMRKYRGVIGDLEATPGPDDRCAICGGSGGDRPLFLDHDHFSGRARAWLCIKCNTLIGVAGEDPEILRRAIRYLTFSEDGLGLSDL